MAGFIHGKLDIKLLILFLASRLAAPVNQPTLTELCLCDDGVNYFQLAQCLAELVASGHLSLEGDLYAITDKGRAVLEALQQHDQQSAEHEAARKQDRKDHLRFTLIGALAAFGLEHLDEILNALRAALHHLFKVS